MGGGACEAAAHGSAQSDLTEGTGHGHRSGGPPPDLVSLWESPLCDPVGCPSHTSYPAPLNVTVSRGSPCVYLSLVP